MILILTQLLGQWISYNNRQIVGLLRCIYLSQIQIAHLTCAPRRQCKKQKVSHFQRNSWFFDMLAVTQDLYLTIHQEDNLCSVSMLEMQKGKEQRLDVLGESKSRLPFSPKKDYVIMRFIRPLSILELEKKKKTTLEADALILWIIKYSIYPVSFIFLINK